MPKVQVIINQINKKCPSVLPQITQVFQSDRQRLLEALKQKRQDPHEYVMLRILLSDTLYKLNNNDFLKPLLEINLIDLRNQVLIEARLKICQGIILAQDLYRTNAIDKHLFDLSSTINLSVQHHARIQAINAGNNFLKGDYTKAALQFLAAARMQANVKDQKKKMELVNKAIAFIFISPINQQSHKIICSLCLNQIAKKSQLYTLVSKLYREDIFTNDQVAVIENQLPKVLKGKDSQGISKIRQAAFSRNMIPIINSFSSIKIKTLLKLIGQKNADELLLLLEKTYQNGQISINQLTQIIYIKSIVQVSQMVKQFLTHIDSIIQQ